jgi:cysteine desulfurase / selenocysteine lyase
VDNRWRQDFRVLRENTALVYLDSAASCLKPDTVVDAITNGYARDYATVHRGTYARSMAMTARFEEARQTVAGFIGAQDNELVFTRGATESINLFAQSWGGEHLSANSRVVITMLEHHSNIVPWHLLQKRLGFTLEVINVNDRGHIDRGHAQELLSKPLDLLSVAHVSNVTGDCLPIDWLAALAKAQGALLHLDACQS